MRLTPSADSPRRRPAPRWLRRLPAAAALAAVAVVAAAGGWHLWTRIAPLQLAARAQAAALAWTAGLDIAVGEVVVAGRGRTARDDILAALAVERGMPMLAFDPAAARVRLEALGWVRRAHVRRRLPDQIVVQLEERRPLALWQHRSTLALIDRDGAVIRRDGLGPFAGLPVVVGPGANEEAAALLDVLAAAPRIDRPVEAAVLVSGRRWNLRLAGGTDVRLPERGIAAALERLAALERELGVLGRDPVAVDLRLPDRLVVQLAPGAGEENGAAAGGGVRDAAAAPRPPAADGGGQGT